MTGPRRAHYVLLFGFCVAWLLAAPHAGAQPQPSGPGDPAHRWGINDDHHSTGPLPVPPHDPNRKLEATDVLTRAKAAGFGWVRYVLFWHAVNPRNPAQYGPDEKHRAYEWFVPDVEMDRLRAAGFNVIIHVAYPPTWTTGATYDNARAAFYCLDPSTDDVRKDDWNNCENRERRPGFGRPPGQRSEDFREFVRAAVTRYKHVAKAWSFGMEVHNKVYWKGDPKDLLDEVLRPGYEEVKALDPSLLVVGPDEDVEDSFENLLKLERDGGTRVFDVLAFHAFQHAGWNSPDQVDREWRSGWMGTGCSFEPQIDPAASESKECSLQKIVERYADFGDGGPRRPLWLTEFGYRIADPRSPDATRRQAEWLARWVQGIKARPWIERAFVYRLIHGGVGEPGDFGLFQPAAQGGAPAAALPSLGAVAGVLNDSRRESFLAEGATNHFDLQVVIANPNPLPAPVKITFLKSDGTPPFEMERSIPPLTRFTQSVGALEGLDGSPGLSTTVTSVEGLPLVVERTMFWDKANAYGGHGGSSVAAPAHRWYFGEGSQGYFDTWVLLANPATTPANATITFLREGQPPASVTREVPPQARLTLWANEVEEIKAAPGTSFSIVVDSDRPIIAERAMYFGPPPAWTGGHESAGATAPSTTWFHAEGATGAYFDEYILVGNPNDVPAPTTFTFLLDDGGPAIVGTTVIPANERFTLNVEDAHLRLEGVGAGDAARLANAAVSTKVASSVPVVSERAMYWPGNFTQWHEAHNSFGVTETGVRWGLAEGRRGGPRAFETYILVANPSAEASVLRVTYLRTDGSTKVVEGLTVAPNSRFNITPDLAPEGEFSAMVESVNGVPIVVERAMYWDAIGQHWAGGTNATAVKLP